MPQQTYYLVPGPNGGPSQIVPAPFGNYGQEDGQFPTASLESQYAPVDMDEEGMGGQHIMMTPGEDQYIGMPEEEHTEKPKEKKKKKKTKKEKKVVVEEETTEEAVDSSTVPTEPTEG